MSAPKRAIHLSIVIALVCSLLSFVATPANAVADGTVACSGGGTFTITSNIVTGNTGCTGSAVVPEGVTALGTSFYNSALSSITLPSTLVTIGDSALRETQLVSVVIPASVTSIGFLSLATRGITSVTFAAGSQLTTIGSDAFQSTRFTSITIPASVTSIGSTAFLGNVDLTTINFLGSIPAGAPWSAGNPSVSTVKIVCDGSTRTCQVGENGPGGGTIYYYSAIGFACGPDGGATCNYLEAALSGWNNAGVSAADPTRKWGGYGTSNCSPCTALATAIGSGYKNTRAIVLANNPDTNTAASLADSHTVTVGGVVVDDWYLPSLDELNQMYIQRDVIGGFSSSYYWSSTENDWRENARRQNFNDGENGSASGRLVEMLVRPIRAFAPPPLPATAAAITTQPIGAASGSALGTQPVIRIVNSTGGTVTSSTVNVVASIASGTGTLSGTTTVAAVSGVATFTNLAITGTPGTFTLTFTPTSLTAVTSNRLTVTANAALTPTFGTPTATADGFTVQISNYDAAFTWGGSATASGSVSISGTGLVTVTGVAPGTSSTATITTARTGYTSGSATVSGTSVSNSNVATLATLTISAGTLSPTFATGTYSYTASVLSDTSTVTVTPTKTQANATIQVRVNSGSYVSLTSGSASGSLSLNSGSNTIDVLVTAQDGSTTATYTITVTRAAALAAPAFTLSSSSETATVGTAITGYTITSTGGAIASYSISPAISNGLSFDPSTGRITGTPTAAASAVTYTITARNASTPDATQTFTLGVNFAPIVCSGGGSLIISGTTVTTNSDCMGSAVVPLGVTAIANFAIQSPRISSVNLPKTVTSIGNGRIDVNTVVTQNCGTSGTFRIAQAVPSLTVAVTKNNSCNGDVVIPEGVTVINQTVFFIENVIASTPQIRSLSLPSTLIQISDNAFRGQPLTSVTIPASVSIIGQLAFSIRSSTLKSVTFLGTRTSRAISIGAYAFQYSPMTCITLPVNLANLSSTVFVDVNSLRCVNFLGNAPTVNNLPTINLVFTSATPPTAYITSGAMGFARTNPPNVWNGMPVVTGQGACITYSAGTGGSGTAPATPASVLVGSTFLTPTNTFTPPSGAYFAGWSDGTSTYAEGATYPATGSVSSDVTLTALWSYGTFTVTFQANGGVGSDVTQSGNTTANLRLNTFTRVTYKFLGWNTCSSPVVPYSDGQSYRFRANITLCAQWGRTITYSNAGADSGSPSRASDEWISGTINFPTVGTMVTAGYSFGGWSATSGGSTPVSNSYAPSTLTQTLYPIWTANTYTISFNRNGAESGNVPSSKSWTTGSGATSLGGNAGTPVLAKPGYTFGGWATSASSTTPVTSYGIIQNQTFFAIWTPVTYTITYDLNYVGAPAAPTQASQNIYNTFNLAAKPIRAGWEYGGWSDTATAYAELAPYTITASTPTALTLTAQWIPYFTVEYVLTGSTSSVTGEGTYQSGTVVQLSGEPTRTGYRFVGWRDSTGQTRNHSSNFTVIQNSVLTAQWTPIPITITYVMNSGTSTRPTQSELNYLNTFSVAKTPTRAGYIFDGWSDGTQTYTEDQIYVVRTSNITLTAQWTAISYTVTYDLGGGQLDTVPTQANRTIGQTFTTSTSTPTKLAHAFSKWSDGSNLFEAGTSYTTGAGNVTLTAQFIQNGYTPITYLPNNGLGTVPTQNALLEGTTFAVADGSTLTRSGFIFTGWSDGTNAYQPESIYSVGSYLNPISLTAQWTVVFSVAYSAGTGSGTPPIDLGSYRAGDTFEIAAEIDVTKSGYTFAGWSDGTRTYQPSAVYTVGTSNITFTAQWTANAVAPTPAPAPVTVSGPPPSILKTLTNPKISRDDKGYYCEIGKYVFLREGRTEETPKLTTQIFSLLINGKVMDSIKSTLDKVLFAKSDSYMDSTITCQVEAGQENLVTTSYSLNSSASTSIALAKKNALDAADVKYYKDREDAYAKKDKEFARLAVVKAAAVAVSKSSREILAASANYQKAYMAASELWKKELADASTNRVIAKELAQKIYLESLEAAGISIYPRVAPAVVTPTPTPTPKPTVTPTPTPKPTPTETTNPQPTVQMEKVGTVYMASGSYFLNDATKLTLKAVALKINASGAKNILVYGFTDNRGGVNNILLSQNRAKAVANFLRPLLNSKKISIGWYASKKPVASGNSAAALALNRRVEIYTK